MRTFVRRPFVLHALAMVLIPRTAANSIWAEKRRKKAADTKSWRHIKYLLSCIIR
jgi:hypothetical protein